MSRFTAGHKHIAKVVSAEGEIVPLKDKAAVSETVVDWLTSLEQQLGSTLRSQTRECLHSQDFLTQCGQVGWLTGRGVDLFDFNVISMLCLNEERE